VSANDPPRIKEFSLGLSDLALYGFCRMADDLVDTASLPRQVANELARRLDNIYAGQPEDNPTDRAFADVVLRFAIPRAIPDALIEGFQWDAENKHYKTLSDVTDYGVRVAGTVGVMMSLIMGERRPEALTRAIDLGVAMQFSNIARDLEEDAKLGRIYLPSDWNAANAAGRLVDEAELSYDRAASGIALLPRSCRASINAARLLYREIGRAAKQQDHKCRAIVPLGRKLVLIGKAILQSLWLPKNSQAECIEEGQFLIEAVTQTPKPDLANKSLDAQIGWVMKMLIAVEDRKS
jgi:15-cis-phytoene synthase